MTPSLNLSSSDKAYAGGCAVGSTVVFRMLFGDLSHRFGPRLSYAALLILGAIHVMALGLVQNALQFIIVHFFIGMISIGLSVLVLCLLVVCM